MYQIKICIGVFLALSVSRFIPHPPNFTSLIALSFYIPAIFGRKYIAAVILSFFLTDLVIGFHSVTLFTWGSVLIIGLMAKFFINNISMRIGVNAGSLDKKIMEKYKEPGAEALVESALGNIELLESNNFDNFKISVKASNVHTMVAAYEKLSTLTNYPLHLGLTEAGTYISGSIKSSMSIGKLLSQGIGDTIRVSLTADPVEEIKVGFDLLKSLNLRSKGINFIACPSCSRQNFDVIETINELERRVEDIVTPLDIAILGCIVNGPGEAKEADLGLTGASPANLIYSDGKPDHKVTNENLVDHLEEVIRKKVADKLAEGSPQ